ncbi:MarR family transcriptional regulator [Streptomyces thinghirensis]|nr:MarR family transcriptional regulator [Streptomyces thinghirensis]
MTPGRLREHLGLTSGAVTACVDRLERAGHVRRVRGERRPPGRPSALRARRPGGGPDVLPPTGRGRRRHLRALRRQRTDGRAPLSGGDERGVAAHAVGRPLIPRRVPHPEDGTGQKSVCHVDLW